MVCVRMGIFFGDIMERKMVNISIIVPIYNGEKYIERCMKSLLNQTYQEFEILLIDNNSNDRSFEICKRYAESMNNIILFQEMKLGPGCARNKGLSVATGKYITFLDCDDYWEADYLEKMIKAAEQNVNLDLILCGRFYNEIPDGKSRVECIGKEQYQRTIVQKEELKKNPYAFFKYTGTRGPVCKLFKKSIIDHFNIRFPETIKMMEDLCFCMEYISYCRNIELIESVLYHQFIHKDSLSKSSQLDDLSSWEYVIDVLQKTISKTSDINWSVFYHDLLIGFPMQCINMYAKQNIGIIKCINNIFDFLNRKEIVTYIRKYCNSSVLDRMSRCRICIANYIIKRRIKQAVYKIKSNLT